MKQKKITYSLRVWKPEILLNGIRVCFRAEYKYIVDASLGETEAIGEEEIRYTCICEWYTRISTCTSIAHSLCVCVCVDVFPPEAEQRREQQKIECNLRSTQQKIFITYTRTHTHRELLADDDDRHLNGIHLQYIREYIVYPELMCDSHYIGPVACLQVSSARCVEADSV